MTIGPDGYGAPNPMGSPPARPWQPTEMAYQPPPPGVPAFGPPYGPPPRNRKPLIISLAIGGVVALVVAVVAVVALSGSEKGGGTAGAALTGYLEALARGDAEAALSYSNDQPGSTDFLTDEILKKQIAQMPISDIRILNDDSANSIIGMSRVHVSVKFGDKVSDETVSMKRNDKKEWKLEQAAIKLEPSRSSSEGAQKTLTLFGKDIDDTTVYVFPGWLDIGSNNSNIKVTSDPLLLNGLSYSSFYSLNVKYSLSDTGEQNVKAAIREALADCARSHKLAPPNCPQRLSRGEAVEDTVNWGVPDLAGLNIDTFSEYRMQVGFSGEIKWPLTAKKRDGGDVSGTVSPYVSGRVDLTKNPPKATLR